jgi:hypothetical protein
MRPGIDFGMVNPSSSASPTAYSQGSKAATSSSYTAHDVRSSTAQADVADAEVAADMMLHGALPASDRGDADWH